MKFNLREKAIKIFRVVLAQYLPEGTPKRDFVKNTAYKIALFLAKRNGFLPYFFNNREKWYNGLNLNQQYQISLGNNSFSSDNIFSTHLDNVRSLPISIVLSTNRNEIKYFKKIIDSLISQTYKNWDLTIVCSTFDASIINDIIIGKDLIDVKIIYNDNKKDASKIFNRIISQLQTDYVTFLDCKGILYPDSLYRVVLEISKNPELEIIYADEDHIDINNLRCEPFFKPNWSPHFLLSINYFGNFVVYDVDLLKSINGFEEFLENGKEYSMAIRATEKSSKIGHIPRVLFSRYINPSEKITTQNESEENRIVLQEFLEKKGMSTSVEIDQGGFFIIKPKLEKQPLVSIIIPTKDNIAKLRTCLKSIERSTYKNFEIIIVNNSKKPRIKQFLHNSGYHVLDFNEPFNFSKINNFAVKFAKGEYFLFLNDDIEIIENNWLESLLFYAMQENVGVVGALLLYPKSKFYSTIIQHAGVLIGVGGISVHAFAYSHYNNEHYLNLHKIPRDVSAVTAACMMIRKGVFNQVNGFDENFIVGFGDVDLCLRIKEGGYYIVYNPNVKLFHYEGASRGFSYPLNDEILFLNRWEDTCIRGDEFYNPNLSHIDRGFRLAPYFSDIPAISLLLEIYFLRDDLQQKYPEVKEKKLNKLIDWAATEGVSSDISRIGLVPHSKYYLEHCSEVKLLAEALYHFNHSKEIQLMFPEVISGKYDRLLSYLHPKLVK